MILEAKGIMLETTNFFILAIPEVRTDCSPYKQNKSIQTIAKLEQNQPQTLERGHSL